MIQDARVYPTRRRGALRWAGTVILAVLVGMPSALAAAGLVLLGVDPHLHPYVALASVLVTVGVFKLCMGRVPLAGNARLRRDLMAQIAADDEEGAAFTQDAICVGFSPTPQVLLWHGESDWDIGLLKITGNFLAYWGDRTRWALRREEIIHLELSSELGMPRLLVHWRSATGEQGIVALTNRDIRTLDQMAEACRRLMDSITAWQEQGHSAPEPLGITPQLWGPPPVQVEGGKPLGPLTGWGCAGSLAILVIAVTTWMLTGWQHYLQGLAILAALEAVALGLPALVLVSQVLPADVD